MDCSKTPERRPRPWRLAIGLAAVGVLFAARPAFADPPEDHHPGRNLPGNGGDG
jgi:hypothetical protein